MAPPRSAQTIEQAYGWAKSRKGVLFVDIQAGHSTLKVKLPLLLKYLERPTSPGVDPEFCLLLASVGTVRAQGRTDDVASDGTARFRRSTSSSPEEASAEDSHRPPFRGDMVPDAGKHQADARVQVVMDMDGWGPPWLKFDSYRDYIVPHPVQFTGFKLFYHNARRQGDALLTPLEVLALRPRPIYIQYQ